MAEFKAPHWGGSFLDQYSYFILLYILAENFSIPAQNKFSNTVIFFFN